MPRLLRFVRPAKNLRLLSARNRCAAALLTAGLYCVACLWPAFSNYAADMPRQPNILVILADDLGYADTLILGEREIPTPHIDALAAAGVRCTNGYVSGPYCSPTRAGLLTGRYQQRFGHEFNPGGRRNDDEFGLPLTETTIANRLRAAGYVTGLVGKWHLGGAEAHRPLQRGFDEFFGFLAGAHPYEPGEGAPIYRDNLVVEEREYLTDAFGREAADFVRRHRRRPFFLYLAFNAVHTPLQATDDRLARFEKIANPKRRAYAAMLTAMDEAVGKVVNELRTADLEENTLIFYLSDNGGPVMRGTTVNGASNAPLRGSKRTTLEGGIRVPFVAAWKSVLPAGKIYELPVIQLDILPTALAAAGVAPQAGWRLDGVNLLPYFQDQQSGAPHDTLYWRLGKQMAIRRGDWKLVRYDTSAEATDAPRQVTDYKLYNLASDIGEAHDLAANEPDTVQELKTRWQAWSKELAAPLWGGGQAP